MIKRLLILCTVLTVPACLFASLTVAPARQEVLMSPGAVIVGTYTVTNNYKSVADIKTEARDWFVLPENKNLNIKDWLKIYPEEFTLGSGECKTVNYEVRLPQSVKGELVAMVSFTPSVEEQQGVVLMISSALYVIVAGTEKYAWELKDVRVTKNPIGKLQIDAFIKNNGNIHLRPTGSVKIISAETGKPALELGYREGRPVYPGATRQVVAFTDFNLKPGAYTAVSTINAEGGEKVNKVNFKVTVNRAGEATIE